MTRRILYFVNPISGTRKKDNLIRQIELTTSNWKVAYEILPSVQDGNYKHLSTKIQQEGITDVVICGGDGTIHPIAAALLDVKGIRIGIIPMGSGNSLALAAKLPFKTKKALEVILQGKTMAIDGVRINDTYSFMLAGIGLDGQIAHDFAKASQRGLATYIKLSLKRFMRQKSFPVTIKSRNFTFSGNVFMVCIANSNQFGNQFTIAPKASLSDGLLDIIVVKKMPKIAVLWHMMRQLAGFNPVIDTSKRENFFQKKGFLYFQTSQVAVLNPAAAPLHIDGETAGAPDNIEVEILPKVIHLIHGGS